MRKKPSLKFVTFLLALLRFIAAQLVSAIDKIVSVVGSFSFVPLDFV